VLKLRGMACLDLEEVAPDRKSLIASRSFGQPIESLRELEEAVSVHTARGREDAPAEPRHGQHRGLDRNQQFQADRPSISGVKICSVARGDGRHREIDRVAITGLAIIKPGYRYKKAGVTFFDLVSADRVQARLFDQPDDARSTARMSAIDTLNARCGRGAVAFGTAGERQVWGLRREFISPRYTTVWDELLRA
jgi:DNA polymerase V